MVIVSQFKRNFEVKRHADFEDSFKNERSTFEFVELEQLRAKLN